MAKTICSYTKSGALLESLLKKRIVYLDGAMGTLIQKRKLGESDYRSAKFDILQNSQIELKGNADLLNLTRPDVLSDIFESYYKAGSDIVTTCTFGANSVVQAEYKTQSLVREMNIEGVRLAKEAAKKYATENSPKFVAASIGPMNKSASISPDMADPSKRSVSFDELMAAYKEQMTALKEAKADLFLLETTFDGLNAKAAVYAYLDLFENESERIPIAVSMTVSDASGRILSGQTIEAFYNSIEHCNPLFVGLNCSLGADKMRPYIETFNRIAKCYTHCYPNAGLPNPLSESGYDQTPEMTATYVAEYAKEGLLNVIGGCCGTTPEHIAKIIEYTKDCAPRIPQKGDFSLRVSGLQELVIPESNAPFILVGERNNVMGSGIFRKAIKEGRYNDAVAISRKQIENGANVIDINFDEAMLDAVECMRHFLRLLESEPEISKVPFMIDSSNWAALKEGLKNVQGKPIVNSLSLKEGEETFLKKAKEVKKFGAALVVMAFDENGQAATKEDKVRICRRAYSLLVDKIGFNPCDIIFDVNVLTIGTGIAEHNNYGKNFIEAVREVKQLCPHCRTSAGVSNLSFAFRGNNPLREAMHSVFLFHAIKAGLDMGIVNAGVLPPYDSIKPELRDLLEDLIFNKRADATERVMARAADFHSEKKAEAATTKPLTLEEKLQHCFIDGDDSKIAEYAEEYYSQLKDPLAVIEGPLMGAMKIVGKRFGEGKMFLPQVVKSARVMKTAVETLEKYMSNKSENGGNGKFLIATVKGDVHDIGKNIVALVMGCNSYAVRDLGVMVDAQTILDQAKDFNADLVGMSGLITPSLAEMENTIRLFERNGMTVPIVVGGASTSELHTAVKLAPLYSGAVMRVEDASTMSVAAADLTGKNSAEFIAKLKESQRVLRENFFAKKATATLKSLAQSRLDAQKHEVLEPEIDAFDAKLFEVDFNKVLKYLRYEPFFAVWHFKGITCANCSENAEAKKLYEDAQNVLAKMAKIAKPKIVAGVYAAEKSGTDDIVLESKSGKTTKLCFFRNQESHNLCLADFAGKKVGLFALTAGNELWLAAQKIKESGNEYEYMLWHTLSDRIAEACAEYFHTEILCKGQKFGIRPAIGYPICPDHTQKTEVFEMLNATELAGISLTENFAMTPPSSICALWLPDKTAKYFDLGKISEEQIKDFCQRRNISAEILKKYLAISL